MEYLVRHCVREVLSQMNEGDEEIKGAAAPPADGQGTADTAEIPNDKPKIPEKPSEPETPPASPDLKGLVIVNPKDKAKLEKVTLKGKDDASIERELHRIGATKAGSGIKVAISTLRAVKDAVRNPNTATYLYFGKYDPQSDEIFLMADKSLQVAKDASIQSSELMGTPVSNGVPTDFNPMSADASEFAGRIKNQGQTPNRGLDEGLKSIIKKMINECLDK